jgi:hypothetical protein
MNKKAIIIILGILAVFIISIITWLLINNKSDIVEQTPLVDTTPSTTSTPLGTESRSASSGGIIDSKDKSTTVVIKDTFQWSRILFFNENDISKRLQNYFKRTNLDQKIILDKCNLAEDSSCLADFKNVLQLCKLSGEELSHLPLAFDRSTSKCYVNYADITNYLNSELEAVNKARQ